ncbi:MAG: HAD family phosphatase [Alphaproteobacteria bacterium]|nr:HAD family phosphatase [Alphaproteobacteria bacterium]
MHRPIIFDFDGVIVDSEVLANRALAECLTELGLATTTEQAIERYIGIRLRDCILEVERRHSCKLPSDFDRRCNNRFHQLRERLQPVPGAPAFIRAQLPERTAIASSTQRHEIGLSLQAVGLADFFTGRIFSAADLERGKPHPDVFLAAAKGIDARPEHCIVIEDGHLGTEGAAAAGMTVIGLTAGAHCTPTHADRLRASGAHHIATSYAEVANIIARL